MKNGRVRARVGTFERAFPEWSNSEVKEAYGRRFPEVEEIADKTIKRLREGGVVNQVTIERMAILSGIAYPEWVQPDERTSLPDAESDFWTRRLRFSYYVDHDRRADGNCRWREEFMVLRRNASVTPDRWPQAQFYGAIRSWHAGERKHFAIDAALTNDVYFGLVAHSTTHPGVVFHAVFTHILRLPACVATSNSPARKAGHVLAGVWIGVSGKTHALCVYRMFLSTRKLTRPELTKLSRQAPTVRHIVLDCDPLSDVVRLRDERR